VKVGKTFQIVGCSLVSGREGENNLKGFKVCCLKNGSSQGPNLAVTVVFVPNSLDSGPAGDASCPNAFPREKGRAERESERESESESESESERESEGEAP